MAPRTRPSSDHTETDSGPSNSRSKGPLSCAECRRLKLKCDREIPCSNCVRRKCIELCPNDIRPGRKPPKSSAANKDATEILGALGDLLSQHGMSIQRQPDNGALSLIPQSGSMTSTLQPLQAESSRQARILSPARSTTSRKRSRSASPRRVLSFAHTYSPVQPIPADPTPVRFEYDLPSSSSFPVNFTAQSDPSPQARSGVSYESPQESHGTLVLGRSGRSRYLGPTAGPEWLRGQEVDTDKTPAVSRPGSPHTRDHTLAFPFDKAFAPSTAEAILNCLPPEDNGRSLLEAYYRYFAWNHNPAPRSTLQKIFDEVYTLPLAFESASNSLRQVGPQRLALLYIVFALGALHSLELPPNDPSAEEYLSLCKACLAKGDFMRNNTLAGVQALNIMGHYYLDQETGRDGESAWPLWGLVMRIIQAMGLHRDGGKWNLPDDVVEERRLVFWECYAIEVFQANCNSRPSSLQRRHIDTRLPRDSVQPASVGSFYSTKFGLAQISHQILDQAMDVEPPPYTEIQRLYSQLCIFERDVPFHLRCRTAMISTTSVYPEVELALRNSPEVDKRDLRRTFEQFTLALNLAENFLFLQRPYFVRAIHEHQADPLQSPFGDAYLAVVERSSVMIQVVKGLWELYPDIAARHWFYWYHLFTAAVCLGTIPIKNPSNLLSQYALMQLSQATSIYASLRSKINTAAITQNHEWLCKLQSRAQTQVQAALAAGTGQGSVNSMPLSSEEETEDAALLGWRTRLIQHAVSSGGVKTTITSVTPPVFPWSGGGSGSGGGMGGGGAMVQGGSGMEIGGVTGNEGVSGTEESSAGDLLQQLWDDMLQPEARTEAADLASFTSWNWDAGLEGLLQTDQGGNIL